VGSGKTDVRLQIVHADYSAPPGNGTHARGIAALVRLGGQFHFARGDGERLRTMIRRFI